MLRLPGIVLVLAILSSACGAPDRDEPLLNSERIEQVFGSYGVEVVHADPRLRLSSLYSGHDGERITRTFALVGYPERIPSALAAEHATILAGGSIGSTLTAAGWRVDKTNLAFGELAAPPAVALAMQISEAARLALHAYALDVERDGQRHRYAVIIELHHPEYLSREDLGRIYGSVETAVAGGEDAVTDLLTRGLARLEGA